MSGQNPSKSSQESLSSAFSNLEISFSHDSCYASDDASVDLTNPTTTSTSKMASPLAPSTETSVRPFLRSILKRPYTEIQDDEESEGSESGYASDASEFEEDEDEKEDKEEDGDDDNFGATYDEICDISDWDDSSDLMSDIMSEYDVNDTESLDGPFISFESLVRFDPQVQYFEAPEVEEGESADTGMTCHEMMEMARDSYSMDASHETYDGPEASDANNELEAIFDSIEQLPEHTSDIVDLDKRLFVAYMNGINGIDDPKYRSRLRARVADYRSGRVSSPFLDFDSANGSYLDHVLSHVIGTFRNIVIKKEFDELVRLGKNGCRGWRLGPNPDVLTMIEHILFERLTGGEVYIGADELSFFASGVAYALENWTCYSPN